MNKKYSIIFLIDSLTEGGAELALLMLVRALCNQKHNVSVFSFKEQRNLALDFKEAGATLYLPILDKTENRIEAFLRLRAVVKNNYFDIIHSSSRNTSMFLGIGFLLARHGCRVVTFQDVHFRAKPVLARFEFIKEKLLLKILKNTCDGFTTDSKSNVIDYNKYSPEITLMHLPNCVPPIDCKSNHNVDVKSLRERMGVFLEDFVIIIPARYSLQKGHIIFFEALLILRSRGVDLPRVICYGTGDKLITLSKFIKDNNLDHKVTFNRTIPIDELQLFILAADLVVLPSLWESFGQVVVSSMSLGKAVLGSNTGGISEQITHDKTGFLAPPGDPLAWADELECLLSSPSKLIAVGKAAKESIRKNRTSDEIASELIRYYGTLLQL